MVADFQQSPTGCLEQLKQVYEETILHHELSSCHYQLMCAKQQKAGDQNATINIHDVKLTTDTPTTAAASAPTTSATFLAASKNCTNLAAAAAANAELTCDGGALSKILASQAEKDDFYASPDSVSPQSELESSTQQLLTDVSTDIKAEEMKALSLRQRTIDEIIKAHLEQNSTTTARPIVSAHVSESNEASVNSSGDVAVASAEEGAAGGIAAVQGDSNNSTDNNESQNLVKRDAREGGNVTNSELASCGEPTEFGELDNESTPTASIRSIGSFVCRICHNAENPERLVSPCLCKGSLTYVHIQCLERWISTSRNTTCELCQFQYNTEQTLRYTCLQSLRMWYSRSMSRRALQEDCQMFSLLTLVAFGIIGTLLVGIQYYYLQGRSWGLGRLWTKGWLVFFLFSTMTVYFINIYMIVRSQLAPWYRWWQSARDIKLILENRKPFRFRPTRRLQNHQLTEATSSSALSAFPPAQPQLQHPEQPQQQPFQQQNQQQQPCAFQNAAIVAVPPTPNPSTTMLTPQFSEPLSLHLQFNRNVAMAVAAAAAIAEFDGYGNDNNNNNNNSNYNNNSNNNINKHCADFAPTPTVASVELANSATATVTGVATAAVEIPLNAVVYELATAL